jgi:hypothetical protein
VAEAELTGALGQSRRCDVLVAQVGDYVAMEASVQTMPRTDAGDVASIRAMAEALKKRPIRGPGFAPPAGLEPATCRIDLERVGQCWLMTKTLVVQGIQRLPTLKDVGCHRRFSMSKRCIDLEIGTK